MSEITAENVLALIRAEWDKPSRFVEMKYTHQHMHWAIAAGQQAERERIIKLLIGLIETRPSDWEAPFKGYSMEHIIALIKGENATERTASTLPNAQKGEKPNENPWKGCPGCPECEGENK